MKRTATLMTCLALLIPGAAVASASSTSSSYSSNNTGHKVDNASASRSPKSSSTAPSSSSTAPATASNSPSAVQDTTATRAASTGSLPFTGLDIGALAAGAILLLGAGVVLRRVTATDRR